MFDTAGFDAHERLVHVHDAASGLKAIIAVHSTVRGPAVGGCRMMPYASLDAARDDALRLSRAMTLKTAICELPFGGGKSVVIGDPATDKTPALLAALGRALNELGGLYQMAEDVGTTVADMAVIRRTSPYARGMADARGDPTPATAYGVFQALQAAVRHRFGGDLGGIHVAVQGLGNVGWRLAGYLAEAGARLSVADVDGGRARLAAERWDADVIAPDAIHALAADVFAPCALGGIIDGDGVADLGAPVIAGGANNQLADDHAAAALTRAGIVWVPDIVANAGGVIDLAHEGPDYEAARVLTDCERIAGITLDVLERAGAKDRSTLDVAQDMAQQRVRATATRDAA